MKKIKLIIILIAGLTLFNACKKKFDLPKQKDAPAVSSYITIDSIYKQYIYYYQNMVPSPSKFFKFSSDVNLECTVAADEVSGNIYKTVYVQDATGALQVKLKAAGGLRVGDKIRINLNGVTLDDYGKMVQLDSIDITERVVKISSGNSVTATKMTFNQIKSYIPSTNLYKYQSRLVLLDSVEFSDVDKNQMYADPVGKYSIDRVLLNAATSTITLRTSGYAKFAGYLTPCGKGSIVAIMSQYNSTPQLIIRDYNEVNINSGGCPVIMETFDGGNVGATVGGSWTNYNVTGTVNWTYQTYNGQQYANISNYYSSANHLCETWLISPSLNIASASNPRFSFTSAYNYTGPALQVMVSTNYTGGNPSLATWTTLSPALSTGGWSWVNSGSVSLASYKTANTTIAFKYSGTATSGSTWEVDNVAIYAD